MTMCWRPLLLLPLLLVLARVASAARHLDRGLPLELETSQHEGHRAVTVSVNASTTLHSAQEQARAAVAAGATHVTVLVEKGVHALTRPIVLGPDDSGIEWRGAEGAIITGGASLPLSVFAPVPVGDPVLKRLQARTVRQVLRADISAYGSTLKQSQLSTGNGTPLQLARWPDTDAANTDRVHDHWAVTGEPPSDNISGFSFPASAPIPINVSGHGHCLRHSSVPTAEVSMGFPPRTGSSGELGFIHQQFVASGSGEAKPNLTALPLRLRLLRKSNLLDGNSASTGSETAPPPTTCRPENTCGPLV
eukprot:COSAG02_NODE_14958_length_1220_cov_1.135593_1_plen_306_part_00